MRCFGISSVAAVAALCIAGAFGQPAAGKAAASQGGYANEEVIAAGDSDTVIAAKAAKVLPRANQSAWMRLERTFFIHFGPNTFRGLEWGDGREDPAIFNPSALDADQWIRSIKQAGGNMVVLVAKHHDGLSLWPTRYSICRLMTPLARSIIIALRPVLTGAPGRLPSLKVASAILRTTPSFRKPRLALSRHAISASQR